LAVAVPALASDKFVVHEDKPLDDARRPAPGKALIYFVRPKTMGFAVNPGGGTLSGTTMVTAVGGVATFSNLIIDRSSTGYRLQATSGSLTSATSAALSIIPGVATQLAFTVQPTSAAAGSAIVPAVQVTARDASGNRVTGFTGGVSVVIGANPGGGTLSGTATQAAVGGVASFGDLSIDKIAPGYTLVATSGSLASATSAEFTVSAGAVSGSQSSVSVAPGTVPASGGSSVATITVTARDAFGNPIQNATVA
jgi:hypothetical protein